jgi:membrane protease YdiL (CAAX protease family)
VTEAATAPAATAPPPRWGIPDAVVGWVVVQLLAGVWLVGVLIVSDNRDAELDDLSLGLVALTQLGLAFGFVAVPWAITRWKGNGLVADLGLRVRPEDAWRGGGVGILTQLVVLPLVYWPLLEVLDKGLDDLEGPAKSLSDRVNGPADAILLVVIVGVMAPVCEEIFYRGLLQRAFLRTGMAPGLGVGLTSVVFGASHFQLLQLPGLVIAGAVFGVLAYRADRLGPAIAAHMTFNLVTVAALLAA